MSFSSLFLPWPVASFRSTGEGGAVSVHQYSLFSYRVELSGTTKGAGNFWKEAREIQCQKALEKKDIVYVKKLFIINPKLLKENLNVTENKQLSDTMDLEVRDVFGRENLNCPWGPQGAIDLVETHMRLRNLVSVRWSEGIPEISNKQFLYLLLRNVTKHSQCKGLVWAFFSKIRNEKYLIRHFLHPSPIAE